MIIVLIGSLGLIAGYYFGYWNCFREKDKEIKLLKADIWIYKNRYTRLLEKILHSAK